MLSNLQNLNARAGIGGSLCLDFINTVIPLDSGIDLPGWGRRTGFLSANQGQRLERLLRRDPQSVNKAARQAQQLRETLYRVFSRVAARLEPAQADLKKLRETYAKSIAAAEFGHTEGTYQFHWAIEDDLEAILHLVSQDAVRLLGDATLSRVKSCPSCGWLFLDSSKNGSRRWCSMDTCGARDKMRRYYRARNRNPKVER